MTLRYIPPQVVDRQPVVQLELQDVVEEEGKWNVAMIAYIIGENPGYNTMKRYIALHWLDITEPDLFLHDEGYYMIKFQSMVDMHKVFYDGPHTINNRPIIVKIWTPDFDLSQEFLADIPLWVILPKLPMSCWGSESLSKIASAIGKLLFADECTTKQTRISYARMLIEVNITKTLPTEITVMDPRGRKLQQQLAYDWKPNYCDKCQMIGHICPAQKGPKMQKNEKPKRRREQKKVTYEWRYKGPVGVETTNKVNR
ncbi:uncharacterized protein LOC107791505 [Nicotiana tabacum]|uniref:Uncharacterized protein LOC107791505 n=1 Tax=Nicotiana tabacum TaxID=4097 RepID=A0A1S3ZXQ8_TOBAC|nr:PREDICTED: uncharacterized protein LOC107791505 [Nicotiana tabacum]XP_033508900.1 uncharacterized protein LOC117273815 [Nicotiana tomentosiformis]